RDVLSAFEYVGKQSGHWIGVPATPGSQMTIPCARIDLLRQHAGLDITKMYPPEARRSMDLGHVLGGRREMLQRRLSIWPGPRTNWRLSRLGWCAVRLIRRGVSRRQRQRDGQLGCDQAGIGIHEGARAIPAARRVQVG